MNKEEIRKQAKKILDEFMEALNKAEEVKVKVGFDRKQSVREAKKKKGDADFKKRIMKNAPKKEGDYLVAEKKKW